jgi:hypothetical protein
MGGGGGLYLSAADFTAQKIIFTASSRQYQRSNAVGPCNLQ